MRISDWSSDVCSSDLIGASSTPHRIIAFQAQQLVIAVQPRQTVIADVAGDQVSEIVAVASLDTGREHQILNIVFENQIRLEAPHKIGIASCRERVCQYG